MTKTQYVNPMKLSKSTLDILRNFSSINASIRFKKGQEISTISIQKNILARVVVKEDFPQDFAIYDLSEFLSGLSLFDDPEFDFSKDGCVKISDGRNTSRYFFADPSTIVQPPEKRVELPTKDVCFTLSASDISNIIKAAGVYSVEDVSVVGDGERVKVVVRDKKNDTSNNFAIDVGTADATFCFNFKVENLKIMPGSYSVVISQHNASLFKHDTLDLEYLIALELDSKYEG